MLAPILKAYYAEVLNYSSTAMSLDPSSTYYQSYSRECTI